MKSNLATYPSAKRTWQGWKVVGILTLATIVSFSFQSRFLNWTTDNSWRRLSYQVPQWKDDVWPYREQEPWDISTDFPFPIIQEWEVEEGTWLRLDVHPQSGEIVFDMLGDLYCLTSPQPVSSDPQKFARAHPILLGVPHDSDPRFSPNGDRLVFRSDAELGSENIWVMEWKGCANMALRPAVEDNLELSSELKWALQDKGSEEDLLARGERETAERKKKRLIREGRAGAYRVTNETYRFVSDARFHPSGHRVIASKWYTSSRSVAAGEGWSYPVPSLEDIQQGKTPKIKAGEGNRIIARTLPAGWTQEQYGDQQIGHEQFIWRGNDSLIFSKNVVDVDGTFQYSKDVHKGIYAILSRNLTTGETETLVDAFPGGASRPELSRDGRTLAFVRRVRDKEALVLRDMISGTLRHIWYGVTYDLTPIFAIMGTYPSFAFSPSDDAIIIWSSGSIWRVPLSTNADGEKVAGGEPQRIRFRAKIEKRTAETLRPGVDIVRHEVNATQRVYAFKDLRADDLGQRVVFQAAGVTYMQEIKAGNAGPQRLPVLDMDASYYTPSFVPHSPNLVVQARWSPTNFSGFELADTVSGLAYDLSEGLPFGRYAAPVVCSCESRTRRIAFLRLGGDEVMGNVIAPAGAGLYIGDIILPEDDRKERGTNIQNIRYIPSDVDPSSATLRFLDGAARLQVDQTDQSFVIDLAAGPDNLGNYPHRSLAKGKMTSSIVSAPGGRAAAFVEQFHVYFVPDVGSQPVWAKPGKSTTDLARLSLDGGHDITWSNDGKKIFWFLGPFLHSLEITQLVKCSSAIQADPLTFGIGCTKKLLNVHETIVTFATDASRIEQEAMKMFDHLHGETPTTSTMRENAGVLAVINATLLTLDTGDFGTDFVKDGVLIVQKGIILRVGRVEDIPIPVGAKILDAMGGLVIPGFIDAHAHWNGFAATRLPARSWEQQTFLAYGCTTLHNPSSGNRDGFVERNMVESGKMIGSRIFHTGDIVYGAGEPTLHQDIVNMDEAYSALIRIKAEGGPASFSYKNYQLPSRASRQRLLLAARNLSMIAVPEGGANWDWDLTYIADGMTTVEHALPVPVLYEDVMTFFSLSGTAYTPTHIVNYGGTFGEQWVWEHEDIANDPKLRQFLKHDILDSITESSSRPFNSYALFNTSQSAAKLVRGGVHVNIGAHGEPPIGLNYHAELFFSQQGGLSNYEVLRAATRSGAISLGIFASVGSLSVNKLADFLIYPPNLNVLTDLKHSRDLKFVVRGGRVWEARTMTEWWPTAGRQQQLPPINAD